MKWKCQTLERRRQYQSLSKSKTNPRFSFKSFRKTAQGSEEIFKRNPRARAPGNNALWGDSVHRWLLNQTTDLPGLVQWKGAGAAWIEVSTDKKIVNSGSKPIVPFGDNIFAEINAIYLALLKIRDDREGTYVVLSDCQYALDYARDPRNLTFQKLFHEIKKKGTRVLMDWVPGHTGDEFNEAADLKAKSATFVTLDFFNEISIPQRLINQAIDTIMHRIWLQTWQKKEGHITFKSLDGKIGEKYALNSQDQKSAQTILLRLSLGVANNNRRLHRMKFKDSPLCNNCGKWDSVNHRLFVCEEYNSKRTTLLSKTSRLGARIHHLESFLRRKKAKTHLIDFISKTNLNNLFLYDANDPEHGAGYKQVSNKPRRRPWLSK